MAYSDVRDEQAREGRRMSHDETSNPQRRRGDRKKKPDLKGHEAFLKALEESGKTQGTQIEVEKMNGEKVTGTVRCSDHFTITVRVFQPSSADKSSFIDRVLFKHDISEFRALQGKVREVSANE